MDISSGLDSGRGNTGAGWSVLAALLVTGPGAVGVAGPVLRFTVQVPPDRAPDPGVLTSALAIRATPETATIVASPAKLANSRGPSPRTIRIVLPTSAHVAAPSQAAEQPSRPIAANRGAPFAPLAAPVIHAPIAPVELPPTQVGFNLTQGASYALLASAVAPFPAQPSGPAGVTAASKGMEPPVGVLSHEEEVSASLAPATPTGTLGLAAQQGEAGAVGAPDQGASVYKYGARGIELEVEAVINGAPAGKVPLLIADGENISVRLADILTAIQPLMDPVAYDTLSASKSAGEYVTFNTLRASGIAVSFGSNDQLILGSN